jgi:hypothetical protein
MTVAPGETGSRPSEPRQARSRGRPGPRQPRQRPPWRLLRGGAALLVFPTVYLATLLSPQLFFGWAYDGASIHVRSDAPIAQSAAEVIALAEAKLRRSPLFDPRRTYPMYVCNTQWRWNYFSGFEAHSRGFQTPVGRASFIRAARWDENHLAGPDGQDGPRSLDVYIAHEITHMMVADHIGLLANRRLPVWLREGYAEYVARHDTFDYEVTRALLLAGDAALASRDRYWKYLLLVAHLLDREGQDPSAVLNAPPSADAVEARVRAGTRQ